MAPLDHIYPEQAKKAREILEPFREQFLDGPVAYGAIQVSGERADRLEQAICEALVTEYDRGWERRLRGML